MLKQEENEVLLIKIKSELLFKKKRKKEKIPKVYRHVKRSK